MLLRGVLENALYALHIFKNEETADVWLNRHVDDAAMSKSRTTFSHGRVSQTLRETDADIAKVAEDMYRRTIDFGAHPNERASSSSMQIVTNGDTKTIKQNYLSGGTDAQVHALKSAAQIGICTLDIFRIVFRHRFDILGLRDRVDALKQNL